MRQRLIDADAYAAEMKTRQDACLELMNAAREMDNEEMYGQKSAAFSVFVEAKLTLDAMPTVDAVPVVRCGECKHFIEPDEEPQNGGKKYVWCKYWRVWKPEDGFCDVGRPKGENA